MGGKILGGGEHKKNFAIKKSVSADSVVVFEWSLERNFSQRCLSTKRVQKFLLTLFVSYRNTKIIVPGFSLKIVFEVNVSQKSPPFFTTKN